MNTRTGIVPALSARVAAHGAALAEAAQGRWLFTPGRERARPPHRHRPASSTLPESGPVWVAVWERPPARATLARKCRAFGRRYGGGPLRRAARCRASGPVVIRQPAPRCKRARAERRLAAV